MSATMNRRTAFRTLGAGTADGASADGNDAADQQLKLILRRLEQVPARLKYAKPGFSNRVNSGIESALGNLTTVQGTDASRQIAGAKAAIRKSDGRTHAALPRWCCCLRCQYCKGCHSAGHRHLQAC